MFLNTVGNGTIVFIVDPRSCLPCRRSHGVRFKRHSFIILIVINLF